MMARPLAILLFLSYAIGCWGFNFTVVVGRDEVTGLPGVGFAPSRTVTRDNSDLIVFRLNSGSHRVVETSFANPCSPIGTFDTQVVSVPNGTVGATAGPIFAYDPPNATSIHYFADIGPSANNTGTQCQQGAVFCLNTDETSSQSCIAFRSAALALGAAAGVPTSSRPPFTSSTSASSTPSSTRVSSATSAPAASSSRPASAAGKVVVGGGGALAALLGLLALL